MLLHFRARRSIQSCDEPPYNSEEFLSPSFWQQVVDGGLDYPDNPYLFNVFVSGNTFVAEGPNADRSVAIRNDGTYPTVGETLWSETYFALEVPPEWVERSRIWVAGNTYSDIMTRHVEGPQLSVRVGDFQPDIPSAPIIVMEDDPSGVPGFGFASPSQCMVSDPVIDDPIIDPIIDPVVDPVIDDPIIDPIIDPVVDDPIINPGKPLGGLINELQVYDRMIKSWR